MTLKHANIVIGLNQTLLSILTVVPLTISILKSGGGAFGFGLMFLPVTTPLSMASLFGISGLFDYSKSDTIVKRYLITVHILTALSGLIVYLTIPLFPFWIVAFPIAIWLVTTMKKSNIDRQIVLTNLLLLICLISLLGLGTYATNKTIFQYISDFWK